MEQSTDKPSISVFFPCYNDAKSIGKLVEDALLILKKNSRKYEVIVIDDGSTDKSPRILKNLSQQYPRLKLVLHKKNVGYGAALRSGFKKAKYDLIFYTDGDGQYDVGELPILVSLMTKNVDFINGMKMSRQDPNYRIFIGNFYSFFARWAFWLPVNDVDCDYRLIRKKIINKIKLKSSSGAICVELVKKAQRAGARFRQVSVFHYQRKHGQSEFFKPQNIIKSLWEIFRLWLTLMIGEKIFPKNAKV